MFAKAESSGFSSSHSDISRRARARRVARRVASRRASRQTGDWILGAGILNLEGPLGRALGVEKTWKELVRNWLVIGGEKNCKL